MSKYFKPIPCGAYLPLNNVHAVSVSMPTLKDVLAYEEKVTGIEKIIKSGYPRFVLHPYLALMIEHLREAHKIEEKNEILLLSSKKAAFYTASLFNLTVFMSSEISFGVVFLEKKDKRRDEILSFLQYSGFLLSSRFAEDYLFALGKIAKKHQEERVDEQIDSEKLVKETLASLYNQPVENIVLSVTGMNAIFSTYMVLKKQQELAGKDIFLQLGWLYTDTIKILKKFSQNVKVINDISDEEYIRNFIENEGSKIAAIFTEIPTNPLVQTVNLKLIKELADKFNIPIVVDSTIGTAVNLKLNSFADIIIESLTKFACGHGDLMGGAVIKNSESSFNFAIEALEESLEPIYISDLRRLAFEITGYSERVKKIALNTIKLVDYLKTKEVVKDIFWCLQEKSAKNYLSLAKDEQSVCGLVSITFNKPFAEVYDKINLPKGPSLGTDFTLLMPYVYLAHYDFVKTEEGKKVLNDAGIPIDLIRISVGVENIEELIQQFEEVFAD